MSPGFSAAFCGFRFVVISRFKCETTPSYLSRRVFMFSGVSPWCGTESDWLQVTDRFPTKTTHLAGAEPLRQLCLHTDRPSRCDSDGKETWLLLNRDSGYLKWNRKNKANASDSDMRMWVEEINRIKTKFRNSLHYRVWSSLLIKKLATQKLVGNAAFIIEES